MFQFIKNRIRNLTLYQLVLTCHQGAIALIGVDLFCLQPLNYFQHHSFASLAMNIFLFALLSTASYIGLRWMKRREENITEATERFKSLHDHHPDAILSLSLDAEILATNHGSEELLGWQQAAETYTSLLSLVHSPDLLKTLHHFQVASQGTSQHFEAAFLHDQGFPVPTNVTFVPTIVNGEIVGVYAILKDLREFNEQKKEIDKLHKQNQLILNSVSEGIYGIDITGRTIFWNKAAESMTGWKVDEMLGRRIHNLIRPLQENGISSAEEGSKLVATMLRREASVIKEDLFWKKDGTSFPVEYMSSPMLTGNGKLLGTVITFKDITEFQKTQELLIKSDKLSAVGQLAAGVAHEIRNPLTALKGFLKLLGSRSDKEKYYIEIMDKELRRIEFIVNEFLLVSKPQATHFVERTVGGIVESTVELLQPQALMNNIEIVMELDPTLPTVSCDEHQIKQVFINVMKNALEAMAHGGTLHIEACHRPQDKQLTVRFIDQGCGISSERLPKLGEPFYSTKEKGTGLGLMVCYRIIEAHGGFMDIQSKLGEGTTVEISLPTTSTAVA
ncbi:PAS domain S-box protein [Paenibacillus oryzisoli]|uniref:PAS domain-containing sensor histidine kinase n=1 Tax=Paenibacillus oryzisoli TaxID=1850517 RepID=UPI003D27C82B